MTDAGALEAAPVEFDPAVVVLFLKAVPFFRRRCRSADIRRERRRRKGDVRFLPAGAAVSKRAFGRVAARMKSGLWRRDPADAGFSIESDKQPSRPSMAGFGATLPLPAPLLSVPFPP
jgi:hypothetical protein